MPVEQRRTGWLVWQLRWQHLQRLEASAGAHDFQAVITAVGDQYAAVHFACAQEGIHQLLSSTCCSCSCVSSRRHSSATNRLQQFTVQREQVDVAVSTVAVAARDDVTVAGADAQCDETATDVEATLLDPRVIVVAVVAVSVVVVALPAPLVAVVVVVVVVVVFAVVVAAVVVFVVAAALVAVNAHDAGAGAVTAGETDHSDVIGCDDTGERRTTSDTLFERT